MIAWVFPGQGSQRPGMGAELFTRYPERTQAASDLLGWSVPDVCLSGDGRLDQTEFTQPALFVVNALSYADKLSAAGAPPDYLAGHSLGELNALHAAGSMDFFTGLRLAVRRGALMARCLGGGMAVVLGLSEPRVRAVLASSGADIAVAGLNAPAQVAVSGARVEVDKAREIFLAAGASDYVTLRVSGAFHSRHMAPAASGFAEYLAGVQLDVPRIPVVSNVTARPYAEPPAGLLVAQLTACVRWTASIEYLITAGAHDIEQVGPGTGVGKLVRAIRQQHNARLAVEMPAGLGQQERPAGLGQQEAPAGLGQQERPAGLGQQEAPAGLGQQERTA
jgi:malonyl CoA-acyl carrier protein transacylase